MWLYYLNFENKMIQDGGEVRKAPPPTFVHSQAASIRVKNKNEMNKRLCMLTIDEIGGEGVKGIMVCFSIHNPYFNYPPTPTPQLDNVTVIQG